jgi:NAD(P)-dependent dehydrogenase (short-subunit alcohol dehydrogenase family)
MANMQAASLSIGEAFGGLDNFFAKAGIAYATPLSSTDEARYDEIIDRRIRVNALSPGGIDTPLHGRSGRTLEQVQAFKDEIAARVPVGRIGEPEEIAPAALFLAGNESRHVLGAELVVNGGISQI